MRPTPHVFQISVVSFVTTVGALLACGNPSALPVAVCTSVALVLWSGFTMPYYAKLKRRSDERSNFRRREDRRMLQCLLLGILLPMGAAWTAVGVDFLPEPRLGNPAAVGAALAAAIPLTVLVSSAVDWYLILPLVRGVFAQPTCRRDEHDLDTLRAYSKYWVAHRALAELIGYGCLAVLASMIFIAIGHDAKNDSVLAPAVGSLSAGGILAYAGPRIWNGWAYFFDQNVGLGTWARGRGDDCEWIEGFVVDVALTQLKLVAGPDASDEFVPIKNRGTLTEIRSHPPVCHGTSCGRWLPHCEVRERELDVERLSDPAAPPRPRGAPAS